MANAMLVRNCEERQILTQCVLSPNGNPLVSAGDRVKAVITFDCDGGIKSVLIYDANWNVLSPIPSVTDCEPPCDQIASEFQCIRFDQTFPVLGNWVRAGGGGLMQTQVDTVNPIQPFPCGLPGENTFPINIQIRGGLGVSTFGPINIVVASPADWTPTLISAVLNAQAMFSSNSIFWLNGYNLDCILPVGFAQDFWVAFQASPTTLSGSCSPFQYGFAWNALSGVTYDAFGLYPSTPAPGFGWNSGGSIPVPQTGTGSYIQALDAPVTIHRRVELEAIKCIDVVAINTAPPSSQTTVAISYFDLNGNPFAFPPVGVSVGNIVQTAGPCMYDTESREICLLGGREAWLVIGRDTVTGEVIFTRIEDENGVEIIAPVIVDCECPNQLTTSRACYGYGSSFNSLPKDMYLTPPCAPFTYTFTGLANGLPISGSFTVSGSWDIADVGYGVAPQAIADALNVALSIAGVFNFRFHGGTTITNPNSQFVCEYDPLGTDWWLLLTETAPVCAQALPLLLNPSQTWYYEKFGAILAETLNAPAGPYPLGPGLLGAAQVRLLDGECRGVA